MGGSTSTTQQQYPKFVEGFGKDFFKDASRAFNQGPQYFKGSTVTPMSNQTMSALGYAKGEDGKTQATGGGLMGLANANANGAGMSGNLQGIMDNGGFNQGQMDAMASVKDLTNNGLMNELINNRNGFTGQQDRAYQNLQGSVYGNNQQFQNQFNNGGFDANQKAAYAGLNNTVQGNNAQMQNTFNNGGLTSAQSGALNAMQSGVNQNNANYQNTINNGGLSADQQAVQDRNRGIMNSSFDLNSNPAYASVRQNALDTQADALSARAASAGRYGGGMDQAILAREQGKLGGQMDYNEYLNWQNQGNQAASNLASGGQQGINNQVTLGQAQQSGLGNIANTSQIGVNNQQNINAAQQAGYGNLGSFGQIGQNNQINQNNAIQSGLNNIVNTGGQGVSQNSNAIGQKAGLESQLFNMNQAGLQNMQNAYQTAQMPYQTQAQVGQQFEDLKTREMQDKLRRFDAKNPFNHLQQYGSLLSGAPTNTVSTQTPSTLQMLLGGGLGGLGLLGGLGAI